MANLISSHLGIPSHKLKKAGVFDAVVGVDTHLFLDPQLLKYSRIAEFRHSHQKIEKYYRNIITLLTASQSRGDRAWREAHKHLMFKELRGVSIGYGVRGSDGSAIGPYLAGRLVGTAKEIIEMGIRDPEIFELLGLFEEDFGADRLSDMVIAIVREDFFKYTQRIAKIFRLKNLLPLKYNGVKYFLPRHPSGTKPIIFLPRKLLRDLPIALDWSGIDHVVAVNRELRARLNSLIGEAWKNKITKSQLKDIIFRDPNNIKDLVSTYKRSSVDQYDFENDPASEVKWYETGHVFASRYPLSLALNRPKNVQDIKKIVEEIISQFKKNIEDNGLNEHLFIRDGRKYKPRHERYAQRLFYAIADSYCSANDVELSREPDAGSGPVDFKLSTGYKNRVLVEIKLSSNSSLVKGFEKQLPAYGKSEKAKAAFYIVIKVTNSDASLKRLIKKHKKYLKNRKRVPDLFVINGYIQPSASKRR